MNRLVITVTFFFALLNSYAQPTEKSLLNSDEFEILRNYVFLRSRTEASFDQRHSISLLDIDTQVHFQYSSNEHGWSSVCITDIKKNDITYCLNHQTFEAKDSAPQNVTILTSTLGVKTEERDLKHLVLLLKNVKQELFSPENVSSLNQVVKTHEKTDASLDLNCSIDQVGLWSVTKIASPALGFEITQKTKANRSVVSWRYFKTEEEEKSDDVFFKHFSYLLRLAQSPVTSSKL